MSTTKLTFSRRLRETPFTDLVLDADVQSFTVYNRTLLATTFRSLEEDYWHLVEHVQVWDVSCQRQVQLQGPGATRLLQLMTPRDLSLAEDDQCFYLPICDKRGLMLNDPIAIKVAEDTWWLSIADSDLYLWATGLAHGLSYDVEVSQLDVWPIAVQGPKSKTLMQRIFGESMGDMRFFRYRRLTWQGCEFIVARSGWSGQLGYEIYIDDAEAGLRLWEELFAQGEDLQVGNGCPNNIERMEAGLLSFGNDMDYSVSPLQCGLGRFCNLDSGLDSMCIDALIAQRERGVGSRLVGVAAAGVPAMSRHSSLWIDDEEVGDIRSQAMSARYDAWLGFALLDSDLIESIKRGEKTLVLETGDKRFTAAVDELPFKPDELGFKLRPR